MTDVLSTAPTPGSLEALAFWVNIPTAKERNPQAPTCCTGICSATAFFSGDSWSGAAEAENAADARREPADAHAAAPEPARQRKGSSPWDSSGSMV